MGGRHHKEAVVAMNHVALTERETTMEPEAKVTMPIYDWRQLICALHDAYAYNRTEYPQTAKGCLDLIAAIKVQIGEKMKVLPVEMIPCRVNHPGGQQ